MRNKILKIVACFVIFIFFIRDLYLQYVTNMSYMKFAYNLFWKIPLLFLLCLIVMNFDKIIKAKQNSTNVKGICYSIYFAVFYSLFYSPVFSAGKTVEEFVRVIGQGIINNYDCTKAVNNFIMWFLVFGCYFIVFFLNFNYLKNKALNVEETKVMNFLDKILVIGCVNIVLRCITVFSEVEPIYGLSTYSSYLIMLVMICGLAFLHIGFPETTKATVYYQYMLFGFLGSFLISVFIMGERSSWQVLMLAHSVFLIGTIGILWVKKDLLEKDKIQTCVQYGLVLLSFFPFVLFLYTEILNVLNQYAVFVEQPLVCWGTLCFVAILGLVLVIGLKGKKVQEVAWKKWSYPGIVLGISCLSIQIPLESVYYADIFESANYSILISDFFNYGSIPLVEHYGGHMMTSVWEGVLYGIINNDFAGAVFSPYSNFVLPVLAVLFFFLVKIVWDEDAALWVTLIIPFMGNWSYYGLGAMLVLAALTYVKKQTYGRAYIFWLAFVWCALYRLDLGVAFGVAAIVGLGIYTVTYKNYVTIKHLLVSFVTIVVMGCGLWFGLCIWKDINPFTRLLEFIQISLSNSNWAYSSVGDPNRMAFSFCYVFVPFAMVIAVIYTTFNREFRERIGTQTWLLLLMFGISYFTNFSRGLIRHSLAEGITYISIWCAFTFFAIFVGCMKRDMKFFVPTFTILILCNSVLLTEGNFKEYSLVETAIEKTGNSVNSWTAKNEVSEDGTPITYWEKIKEKQRVVTRVKPSDTFNEIIKSYETIIDILLEENETYVDFVNRSFVYSAIGRKNPVYISQSPLQLSGEFTQEQFVRQIGENKEGIPIVLMPLEETKASATLDGIANVYRYYKVSEYIYQNYMPLCSSGEFAVWCVSERYDEMRQKLEKSKMGDVQLIQYAYDGPFINEESEDESALIYEEYMHTYSLYMLPYIWAKYDEQNASANKVLLKASQEGEYFITDVIGSELKKKGNYLLLSGEYRGNSAEVSDETIQVSLKLGIYQNGEFVEKYKYDFTAQEGNNDYIFRVSSDYYWYAENINAVKIECDAELHEVKLKVLEGD